MFRHPHFLVRFVIGALLLVLAVSENFTARGQDGGTQQATQVYLPFVAAAGPPITELPGAAAAPATANIPDLPFAFRAQDYAPDHPELGGLMVSFNTLFVVFHSIPPSPKPTPSCTVWMPLSSAASPASPARSKACSCCACPRPRTQR